MSFGLQTFNANGQAAFGTQSRPIKILGTIQSGALTGTITAGNPDIYFVFQPLIVRHTATGVNTELFPLFRFLPNGLAWFYELSNISGYTVQQQARFIYGKR